MITAFSSYLRSIISLVKALAREKIVSFAVKASLILMGAMAILVAVPFFMFGIARGLSEILKLDLWLGFLITGGAFLLPTLLFFMTISVRARRKSLKRKAEQKKATETLTRKISELVDVRKLAREHPFYSTGAAVAAGFALSGAIIPGTSKESNVGDSSSERHSSDIRSSIVAVVLALVGNVLKEAVTPFIKEHLNPEEHKPEN